MQRPRLRMARSSTATLLLGLASALASPCFAVDLALTNRLHHLRATNEREWTEFPEEAEGKTLELSFKRPESASPHFTLFVRHRDVKHRWRVDLNGKRIGELPRDENLMVSTFAIAGSRFTSNENVLRVVPLTKNDDDVLIGSIRLVDEKREELLRRSRIVVRTTESGTRRALPCRVNVIDRDGALMPIGTAAHESLAIRTGTVYTATGEAPIDLEPGDYTILVGRGFEYGVFRQDVSVSQGQTVEIAAGLRREVDTRGLVACDTHTHTLEHSGHGDASVAERVITVAGEGLDLVIATDHDKHIDLGPTAKRLGVRRWFTPVVGNEVTTKHGHFNIFPVGVATPPPNNKLNDWKSIAGAIRATPGVGMVILNHPRDIHGGFRPFGPLHHNWVVGENLDGERLAVNGVEVINSAALHSHPLRVAEDWLGLINRGYKLAPIGSSDSHEVWAKIVGQGRTYIECDDSDPASIDVLDACQAMREGRVVASLGLLARLEVNGKHRPGDLVKTEGESKVSVHVDVLGPSWANVSKVILYVNGTRRQESSVKVLDPGASRPPGTLGSVDFEIDPPGHDVHIAVAALGEGTTSPHFTIAKTYQPVSRTWRPYLLSVTGIVRVDGNADGEWQPAHEIAQEVVRKHGATFDGLLRALAPYHESIASHAALLVDRRGLDLRSDHARAKLRTAEPAVSAGFERFLRAKSESEVARNTRP